MFCGTALPLRVRYGLVTPLVQALGSVSLEPTVPEGGGWHNGVHQLVRWWGAGRSYCWDRAILVVYRVALSCN